ncbi:hypothetical protein Tco_0588732 [Tanacetum coccineum]
MTSDHNRSELGILVHSNEPSSSKLVPKVVPLAVKTATSRQELELLFHHHIAMLRTTINPMIQPEPEDLPKDNPKLEIAVLRREELKECWIKGCKQRSPPHNLRQWVNERDSEQWRGKGLAGKDLEDAGNNRVREIRPRVKYDFKVKGVKGYGS